MTLSRAIKVLLVLIAVVIAAMLYPPIRLSALVLAGRSPECPLSQAIRAERNPQEQLETKDRILAASKMIGKDEKYEHWQTPKGNFWIAAGSRYVLPFNLAEQERKIYGTGDFWVRKGDVVLDCGANIGAFAREALNSGASKVIAIEPGPENIECLRRNFAPEIADGRLVVYPKGVWDKDDWLVLNVDENNSAADSFVMKPGSSKPTEQRLPLTTIDKLVAELGLPKVDFIKMDIEGAEPNALIGGKGTIAKYHPRLAMSVYHAPDHPVTIPKLIKEAWSGYRMECGPCAIDKENNRIRPDIFYFF